MNEGVQPGAVVYLREVDTMYLAKPTYLCIKNNYGAGDVTALYFFTDTDTSVFSGSGIRVGTTKYSGTFSKTVTVTQNGGSSQTKDTNELFGAAGYLSIVKVPDLAGDYQNCRPYWVTYDGIEVVALESSVRNITIS